MLDRLKNAARWGRLQTRLRRVLTEAECAAGAEIRPSAIAPDLVIITLGEGATPKGGVSALREALSDSIGTDLRVELVTTARNADGAGGQSPAQPPPTQTSSRTGGHDNPLGISRQKPSRTEKKRPAGVTKVLVVASGKGGVGKSTVAALLARSISALGQRTGLLDLDIYGPSVPLMFGCEDSRAAQSDGGGIAPVEAAGLSLASIGFLVSEAQALAWRGPMVMGAAKQLLEEVDWPGLDWLVIDTPPGTGDAHLSLLQRTVIDGVILVSTPSRLALADLRRGAALFGKMGAPVLGLVENMAATPGAPSPCGEPLAEADLTALGLTRLATLPLSPDIAALAGQDDPALPDTIKSLATRISELDPADGRS